MEDVFLRARRSIEKRNFEDKKNMPEVYFSSTEEEKIFINTFYNLYKYEIDDLIITRVSGHLNFTYKNMQIGRIKLNRKKRMQILTIDNVDWIEDIDLKTAIFKLDEWFKYLDYLHSRR